MRILVWSPWLNPGGGSRLVGRLVRAIAADPRVDRLVWAVGDRRALDPHDALLNRALPRLLTSVDFATRFRHAVPPFGSVGERVRNYIDRFAVRPVQQRFQQRELERLAHEANVVYVPWPHRLEWLRIDRPVVCTIQDTALLEFPEILGGPEAEREIESIAAWLRRCARVVVSSESTRLSLARIYGSDALGRVSLIQHAILPERSVVDGGSLSCHTRTLLRRLPARYIACLTNITAHKNLEMLLIAWSRFAGRGDMALVFAGQGTEVLDGTRPWSMNVSYQQDRLSGLMRRLGLLANQSVVGLGYLPDDAIGPVLRGARALINPSLLEGGGSYPVEEALALSIPVLCSDIPVMREHLADRLDNVVWFDPLSVPSILEAFDKLAADYQSHKAAAQAASTMPRPSWDFVASRYVETFDQVIGSHGGPVSP